MSDARQRSDRAGCGCVIGSLHRYACGGVGHVDRPKVSSSNTTAPVSDSQADDGSLEVGR